MLVRVPRTPILQMRHVVVSRGKRRIYSDFSLNLERGVTALLGPNGAGKSTLIAALLRPDRLRQGSVLLDGTAVTGGASLTRYHSRLGHMPQDWSFFSGYTAQQSVEYVAWLKGLSGSAISSAARDALERVRLAEHRTVPVRKMSGGMRQRVGLAESLVNDPSVLLLDEPTVGLDPAQRAAFRDVLASEKQGRAVLLSTHLTDDVEAVADRVVVVADGGIHFDGTPRELAQLAGADSVDSRSLEAGYLAAVSAPTPPNG